MAFKDLTDACMSLLNNDRIDDVFINNGYVEIKATAFQDGKEKIHNSKQLEKELKGTSYLTKDSKVKAEYVTTRKGYRFWNVSLEE